MSRDIVLPGGDTLKLFDSAYTGAQIEALLRRLIAGGGIGTADLADGAVTWPKLAVDALPTHRNLLDNWYFLDPINQRGQTEYKQAGYTLDRWYARTYGNSLMSIAVQQDGIALTVSAVANALNQPIEYPETILGKTVTLSALVPENTMTEGYMGIFLANSSGLNSGWTVSTPIHGSTGLITVTGKMPKSLGSYSMANFGFWFSNGVGSIKFTAVKLELGDHQTLAHQDADGNWVLNDPPPDKTLELAKCQRDQVIYSAPIGFSGFSWGTGNGQGTIDIALPVPMRATPTIESYDVNLAYQNGKSLKVTRLDLFGLASNSNRLRCRVTIDGSYEVGQPLYVLFNSLALNSNP